MITVAEKFDQEYKVRVSPVALAKEVIRVAGENPTLKAIGSDGGCWYYNPNLLKKVVPGEYEYDPNVEISIGDRCLIGEALHRLGVSDEELCKSHINSQSLTAEDVSVQILKWDVEWVGIANRYFNAPRGITLEHDRVTYWQVGYNVAEIQREQDKGRWWGSVVEEFRNKLEEKFSVLEREA